MKASISEIPKRNQVKKDTQKGIFNNGQDNAYPSRIERIINGSVTAKSGTSMLGKFLIGDGFEDESLNSVIVSSDLFGEISLLKLHSQVCRTVAKQNAASLQIEYNGNLKISGVKHIPYRDIRFGLTDSNDYSGFIHYYNNWAKDLGVRVKDSDIQKINTFNPNPDIVKAQWTKYGNKYKGQMAVLRLDDEYIYPLAPIDSALEDADTESQIKFFKNSELNRGFFAKYILHHTKFENEQQQQEFKEVLKKFQGGNHDASILFAESEFDETGTVIGSTSIKLDKIEQNINDKIFESYEKSVASNIRKALFSIPAILIEQQEGGFFGSSGEAFIQAFNFYNTQTSDIRTAISQWYSEIFKHSADINLAGKNFTIKKLSYGTVDAGGSAKN